MKIITTVGGKKISQRSARLRRKRSKAAQFAAKRKKGSLLKKVARSRKNSLSDRIRNEDKRFTGKLARKGLIERDPKHYRSK